MFITLQERRAAEGVMDAMRANGGAAT